MDVNISLWIAGLIIIAIDDQTIDHVEMCLCYATKSVSLFLSAVLSLRLAVCPTFLWLLSAMQSRLAHLWRRWDVRGETYKEEDREQKNDPSEVTHSAFMKLVTQSLESTGHFGECILSLLKSFFFLSLAFLHLFQGSLCLLTAAVRSRISVSVLVCAAAVYYFPMSWPTIV